jgi:hypothetical protein
MWTFEPHVAENILFQMINQARIPVYFDQRLRTATKEGAVLREISMENGKSFRAKVFIDASYEGDLMARAGVNYTVGRESNATYNETLNGIRAETPKHQFNAPVDPYNKPGDANSGLLPFLQDLDRGSAGTGDRAVQAYNFRLCYTRKDSNRLPHVAPPGYTPQRYELLARYLEKLVDTGHNPKLEEFWNPIWMPNYKTDINNNGGFSTDFIGANYGYPEGDFTTRSKIWQEHENYTRGFIYFLATSPRVPKSMREEMQTWGPAKDEFLDTDGWPHQLYVREARRLVGEYVMTEHNCRGRVKAPDPIGLAAYTMDSHNCRRLVVDGQARNEGDVQVGGFPPYPISFRALMPKRSECENLLVPVCLSATHIAYGSIRMEPVFMILGQSAGAAAALAIERHLPVQELQYSDLRPKLLARKQVLQWVSEFPNRTATALKGTLIDDSDGTKTGLWVDSANVQAAKIGSGYIHDNNTQKGQSRISFNPKFAADGLYEIRFIFPPHQNRATNVPVTISIAGKETKVAVDERRADNEGGISLGIFKAAKDKQMTVTVSNEGTDGYVAIDGLQFLPAKKPEEGRTHH